MHVGAGAADDAENLARRRLLLERLRERGVAGLQLLEQTDVLDRDDGLVREDLDQRNLLCSERARLEPADRDDAHHVALAHERDRQDGAEAGGLLQRSRLEKIPASKLLQDVFDVNRSTLDDGAAGRRVRCHPTRLAGRGDRAEVRHPADHVPVHPHDQCVESAAQSGRALGDRIEDGLDVGR